MPVITEDSLDAPPNSTLPFNRLPPSPRQGICPKEQTPSSVATKLYSGLGTTRPSHLTPPPLPEGVTGVAQISEPWFAVHTRIDLRGSRDFALAWQLYLNRLPYYHPQAERIVLVGKDRERKKKTVSLFCGYLFVAGDDAVKFCRDEKQRELCDAILREPRTGQIAADLLVIEAGLQKNPRLQTHEIDKPGIVVRVKRGPFMHHEGIVDELKEVRGVTTVYLSIKLMERSVPIEMDISDLERV